MTTESSSTGVRSTGDVGPDLSEATAVPSRRESRRWWGGDWWKPGIAFVVAIALWQFAATREGTNSAILPSPLNVLRSLGDNHSTLLKNLGPTAYETILGFLIAVVAGILAGVILGNSKQMQAVFMPFVVVFQLIPKVALAPLFIVWFGFGSPPKILLTVLISFFPIVINAFAGIQSVSAEQRELGALLRCNRIKMLRHIQIRAALPSIFNGLKVAITLAVIGAIVAEFVAADHGLGYLLVVTQTNLDTALMFAAVVVLTVFGALLYAAVVFLEHLMIPWHISRRRER